MNKEAIVTAVAASTHTTKGQTAVIITQCLEVIRQAVQRGDVVKLRGFGRFAYRASWRASFCRYPLRCACTQDSLWGPGARRDENGWRSWTC